MKSASIIWPGALLLSTALLAAASAQNTNSPRPPSAVLAPRTAVPLAEEDEERRLLDVGKVAPDFSLPQVGGGELSLANTLKTSKWVLVSFWSAKSEASKAECKTLQKLFDDSSDKGLDIIAVNPVEPAPAVQKFMAENQFSFKVAIDGQETNHAVTGVYHAMGRYPTTYLLDPGGKILWRATGHDEAALKEALTKAGLK